jgi:hypothetical protein
MMGVRFIASLGSLIYVLALSVDRHEGETGFSSCSDDSLSLLGAVSHFFKFLGGSLFFCLCDNLIKN